MFREQFDSLVKDISSAMDVIRNAVQQVCPAFPVEYIFNLFLLVCNATEGPGRVYG